MKYIKTCFTSSEYTYLIYDKNLNISKWTFIIKELKLSNFSQLMLQYLSYIADINIVAGKKKQTRACTHYRYLILFYSICIRQIYVYRYILA